MIKKVSNKPLKNTVPKMGVNTRQNKVADEERHSVSFIGVSVEGLAGGCSSWSASEELVC